MRSWSAVKVLLLALILLMPATYSAAEDSVVVIVNSDNAVGSVTPAFIKKLYKNRILKWPNGVPVTLYDLSVEDPVRQTFSNSVLGMSPYRVAERWAHLKITNQARNPPFTMKSQSLIIRRVSSQKGAIGYVLLSSVVGKDGVRIVTNIP